MSEAEEFANNLCESLSSKHNFSKLKPIKALHLLAEITGHNNWNELRANLIDDTFKALQSGMNLDSNPTVKQLQALFASKKDGEGVHVLYVDKSGDVHLHLLEAGQSLRHLPDCRIRFEAFAAGGYVGKDAALDITYIKKYFDDMIRVWPMAKTQSEEVFMDDWI